MKATKIIGAVLGVLLVAALFTGAVAAADPAKNLTPNATAQNEQYVGTMYAYGVYTVTGVALDKYPIWTNENGKTITFIPTKDEGNGFYIDGAAVEEEGDYVAYVGGVKYHITVLQPTAVISGSVYKYSVADLKDIETLKEKTEVATVTIDDAKEAAKSAAAKALDIATASGDAAAITTANAAVTDAAAATSVNEAKTAAANALSAVSTGTGATLEFKATVLNGLLIGALTDATVMNDKSIRVNTFDGDANPTGIAYTKPEGDIPSTEPKEAYLLDVKGKESLKAVDLGIWTMQAVFQKATKYTSLDDVWITKFAPDYIFGKPYYFTVVASSSTKKLEALDSEITQGGSATIQLTAPTGKWTVSVDSGKIPAGTPFTTPLLDENGDEVEGYWVVTVGANGVTTFPVTTDKTSNIKVELRDEVGDVLKSATVKVKAGAITATATDASVIIGNEFDVEGTNDLGGTLYFFIKGTNFKFQPIMADNDGNLLTASGKVWSETIDTYYLKNGEKKPDAGTYAIYVASLILKDDGTVGDDTVDAGVKITDLKVEDMDESKYVKAYATASVALKQPFIAITKAPDVLVQGEKLVVEGTAEGEPKNVQFYIFGTNYFNFGSVAVTDGTYSVEVQKEYTKKDYMAAGQYFLVIQHPMYDKVFNIGAAHVVDNALVGVPVDATNPNITTADVSEGDAILNKNGAWYKKSAWDGKKSVVLFNTDKRQSANAAQALCDALDSQDIDDMYAKASFIVNGPTSYIDAIPAEIQKGQVLTVSGTTTGHKDDVVTVELLSTAFAAVPKETVGSASFVALTTKIDESGVWSITFDTSNLDADEYTCSVAVGQLNKETSKITIVEGAGPQPTETTPVTPTGVPTAQPTATPATPGFGALAALAGLGAVAVLLLRRQ